MPREFANPFNLPLAGIVAASGALTITFGPPANQMWELAQVSIEMLTAPIGALANLFYMNSFVSAAPSARRASASGDPPIFLHGGEIASVVWTGATPGDTGKILVIYRKTAY